jgi:hypothetical protein
MEKPKEVKPSVKTSYEAPALYDLVRGDIWLDYRTALEYLDYINEIEAGGFKVNPKDRKVMRFKASIMRLYHDIKPKLDYPKYPEPFKKLRQLERYVNRYSNLAKMDVYEACEFFMLEREFIEVDGISKFEREKDDIPKEYVMAKLAKGIIHGTTADSAEAHKQDNP